MNMNPPSLKDSESNLSHLSFLPEEILSEEVAPIQEIFSSIQGEGIYVGKRQIFVRFAHCHLKCAYCDTPMTSSTGKCHVEKFPGKGATHLLENPVSSSLLIETLQSLTRLMPHHSISFTGGEPLLYHRYLKQLFPALKNSFVKEFSGNAPAPQLYLETSGTQADFLEAVLPWVDIIAMDIKLPSATQEPPQFQNHARFYKLAQAQQSCELFIKLIFTPQTTQEELEAVCDIVTHRNTPIILQPMTCLETQAITVNSADIFRVESYLTQHFKDVRVIPQTHKMMRVL
ncbi:MAG: 7-carboxy-7-deazaguanine synthase QueE [Cyanobacteria bacterium]|nr:7-carboxy-7-deazaguanine synthase QueE [Cyanobacteriota bacterium]